MQFWQKKGHRGRWACCSHKKRLNSPLWKLELTHHAIFAIKKLCLQKNYFTLCTFNSNASSNFHKKMSYGWLGSLCSQKNIPLTSFMFDSYTLCYFYTKKTDHRGRWACCAHIKILHSPHLHCLSHDMQFSKKKQVIWAFGLTAFERNIWFTSFTFYSHQQISFWASKAEMRVFNDLYF